MINKKFLTIAVLSMLTMAACNKVTTPAGNSAMSETEGEQDVMIEQSNDEAMMEEDGVEEEAMMAEADYSIDMSNFKYSIKELRAKPGDKIMVKLKAVQGMHDFVIDELKVKSKVLQTGEEEIVTIEVPANSKGKTYEFYCSVGNHRAQGMVGKLMVE